MSLKIFNTLTNSKDEFKPRKGKEINLFVCGPTVYDYSHLGHARNYVVFDSFVKYLKSRGLKVFYLQNITDLDDKIIARAREKQVSPKDLAVAFEKEYLKDMKTLGITTVSRYARATDHIKPIISQIERLMEKGFAYKIEHDGIYFNIAKFSDYGKLAGRTVLDAEDAVTRIDYSKDKANRGDFCVWKFKQESSEPSWPAPFGEGRPGWHIEDTAITEKFLGPQYDIHGGGRDLIFPHHQAEIALMESISGKSPLAKYWMHVGFLTVNGQKMSKSVGNFITLNDFLQRCPANYLRFYIAKNLWSSPMDYSESALIEVKSAVGKVEEFLRKIRSTKSKIRNKTQNLKLIKKFKTDFFAELETDFNTPKAFAVMFDLMKTANELVDQNALSKRDSAEIYKIFQEIDKIFGFINFKKVTKPIPAGIKKLAKERDSYRKNKDWQKADQIRLGIEKQGYTVEDTPSGPFIKTLQ